MVIESRLVDYHEFERQKGVAISKRDFAEHTRLSDEQKKLCQFRPVMMHSFEENANPIVFHFQLLADFKTIEELGRQMLIELDR